MTTSLEPTKENIIKLLKAVLSKEITREDVSNWANKYITSDFPEIEDNELWEFIKIIGGCDIKETLTEYSYSNDDIKSWIEEINNSIRSSK
jgi:hypothetical protein